MSESPRENQKAALRRRWKQQLAAGFQRDPRDNEKLCQWLLREPAFLNARRVALYAPRIWEPDLTPLWQARPEAACFPRVRPGTREMDFFHARSEADLVPGFVGILEPVPAPERLVATWESSDLILVPGLYFDRRGFRIGGGMGFYDRYLTGNKSQAWGVCWEAQLLPPEAWAAAPHDIPVARVCTPAAGHWTVPPTSPPVRS